MKKIFILCLVLATALPLNSFDFYRTLKKQPLLTIDRNSKGKFMSVTGIAMIEAPFEVIWDVLMDINSYRTYMPRVVESKIIAVKKGGKEVIARFEIEVPMRNTRYTLRHMLNKEKKRIDIYRSGGDLKGSHWHWRFYPRRKNRTLIVYRGLTANFSSFLQSFDDKDQTITVGVNISSNLATIRSIKKRAEFVHTFSVKK